MKGNKKRRTTRRDVQQKRRRKLRERRRATLAKLGIGRSAATKPTYSYEEIERIIDSSDYAPVGDDPYYD